MKKIFKTLLALFILPTLLFSFMMPAAKPNFTGTWKLNEGKSELGEFGGRFAARTISIDQNDNAITFTKTSPAFNGGENTTSETLTYDGKEAETTVFGGAKKKSTAAWSEDGETLTVNYIITFERDGQTNEFKGKETWLLTKDGTLSLETFSSSQRGDNTTKAIYEK